MTTPTIDKFLAEIARILREKNATQLRDYILLEPPFPPLYNQIVSELKKTYPVFNQAPLEAKCKDFIPEYEEGEDGGSWTSFITFVVKYFAFLRDVNVDQLVETHDMLKALLNQCILALSATTGLIVLPTVISLSRTLARLAIGLDKRPDLIAHLTRRESTSGAEEAGERVTLVESSANVIREAFKKCLSERSGNASGVDRSGQPEGRRIGIYLTANLCLKLFFHCRKLRSAEQIFGNIYQQSPPLARFPASQRVTFLYYLGRYHFANSHFYRAQLALQAAYNQCHLKCLKQRRLILIYLITANMILGRFPSARLLRRPESQGLEEAFEPFCNCIAKGDLATFRHLTELSSENAEWFLRKRILLQISNRCEVLVWRSLARRTFLLSGFQGDTTRKKAPTLDLHDVLTLATLLERRALGLERPKSPPTKRPEHTNSIFMAKTPEPEDPPGYIDPDLADAMDPPGPDLPSIDTVESTVASLVDQDLLHGFISHKSLKFAITGSKSTGGLAAGFPNVWQVISGRFDEEVPGWVREEKSSSGFGVGRGAGPGMVVNLSGARPVGAASA
ncbi:MAG: hypothetical protein Q9195_001869 [Heterodermia aff. obscurata]